MTQASTSSHAPHEVAIIGAGPYGLSLAAHLQAAGISFRIFGAPMSAWSEQMPKGMHLKSEGFASSLSDPKAQFTLASYCRQNGLPYQETGLPVPLETFVSYGVAFQKRYIPNLENKKVLSVQKVQEGFRLQLDDGTTMLAHKVVMAVGISQFKQIPNVFSGLPEQLITHSSAHNNLEKFNGFRVAIVGGGASALDLAALLHEAGAHVDVIARSSAIRFHDPPQPRSLVQRIINPVTGLGVGRKLFFYTHAPLLFRLLPPEMRIDLVRKTLGPAPGWFIKDRVVGKVALHLNTSVTLATTRNGYVNLQLTDGKGNRQCLEADHVIAATGYRIDVQKLSLLSRDLAQNICVTDKAPALSSNFESSVPGLYFVGVAAANTFGPLMRFAYGARFTARRLSKHLASAARHPSIQYQITGAKPAFERS